MVYLLHYFNDHTDYQNSQHEESLITLAKKNMSQRALLWAKVNSRISKPLFRYNHPDRKFVTPTLRSLSTQAAKSDAKLSHQNDDLFRIAIVGAGSAGLSTALHLAPLVHKGLIAPIDIYETSSLEEYVHPHEKNTSYDEDFHPGSGAVGRDIGVGLWSTALKPFAEAKEAAENCQNNILKKRWSTHVELIQKLEKMGKWVGKVSQTRPSSLCRLYLQFSIYEMGNLFLMSFIYSHFNRLDIRPQMVNF